MATTSREPEPAPAAIPSLERGDLPPVLEEQAAVALEAAQASLDSGQYEAARDEAQGIIRQYPGARGSGSALEILARAYLGLEEPGNAVEASEAFLSLLDPEHPAYPRALLLHGRALASAGDEARAVETLVQLPARADAETLDGSVELFRELLGSAGRDQLEALLAEVDPGHPFRGILEAETAVALSLAGDSVQAAALARAALSRDLGAREAALAEAVLAGNVEEAVGRPVLLGVILPRSGVSPGLMEYGLGVLEGVQVAVQEYGSQLRRPIRLEVKDDSGDPAVGRSSMRELESLGAMGVVGPLTEDLLDAAAGARSDDGVPIISPFAYVPPEEAAGVFSLSGPDPEGARVVARYAWDLGLERVAILRPGSEDARVSAEAFRDTFEDVGGTVPRDLVFGSGATFFQAEFDQVGALLPDGLFLPLQPDEIQLLAPQFTFFGLDTLGIQLLGTKGWTTEEVVSGVDSRHTDGVIASTDRRSQDETDAHRRFREAYEDLFQKTLRTDVPAFGYDAAALLLQGMGTNPRTPAELRDALSRIQGFSGATGRLTIQDGRIEREPYLVRIQDHELIYISSRFQ